MVYNSEYRKKWEKSKSRRRADCHPKKPHRGRGLCAACYGRWLYANSTKYRQGKLEVVAKWKARNEEQKKKTDRNSRLKKKYGITETDYQNLLRKQNGNCAICGGKNKSRRLHVDHDHKTGKVRGLLCLRCNGSLSWVEQIIIKSHSEWIKAALKYLGHEKQT